MISESKFKVGDVVELNDSARILIKNYVSDEEFSKGVFKIIKIIPSEKTYHDANHVLIHIIKLRPTKIFDFKNYELGTIHEDYFTKIKDYRAINYGFLNDGKR